MTDIGVFGGMRFEENRAIPPGFFALKRDGRVHDHGRIRPDLSRKYRPGDIVQLSPGDYEALRKSVRKSA